MPLVLSVPDNWAFVCRTGTDPDESRTKKARTPSMYNKFSAAVWQQVPTSADLQGGALFKEKQRQISEVVPAVRARGTRLHVCGSCGESTKILAQSLLAARTILVWKITWHKQS